MGIPVLCVVSKASNMGKTTVMRALIKGLTERGFRVGTVKRVHEMQIDQPGKDSWVFMEYNSREVRPMRMRLKNFNLSLERLWIIYCGLVTGLALCALPATLWWLVHRQVSLLEGFFLLNIALLVATVAGLRILDAGEWPIGIMRPAEQPNRSGGLR